MWLRIFSIIRSYDWSLVIITFVLSAIGLAAIYSVGLSRGGTSLVYVPTQLLAFAIGAAVFFMAGNFHVTRYHASARFFYVLSGLLLASVLWVGQTIRGTRGWFNFGSFSFQPTEFAKAAVILMLGFIASRVGRRFDRIQYILFTGAVVALPTGLILIQPDLGSAMVMVGVWFGILSLTVLKKRYLAGLVLLSVALSVLGWLFFFKPYQRDRLLTFLQPGRDPLGAGYNVTQSIVAVGAGQIFGRGLGFGSQSQLRFLPEAQTDFIFSVIAEELGLVGTTLVLGLYFLLLWRLITIARQCADDFGAYTVAGVALMFFIHMVLNIGAAIGLLPITGVPLPFLSYGGSSILVNFFLLGIVESVARSMQAA